MKEIKLAAILASGVIVLALVVNYFALERAKIEAQKQVEIEQLHQVEGIERTEERSQFWQKLIPWGDDEDEQGN